MEWHIAPISRESKLTEKPFEKGDRVLSSLVKTEEGEALRIDVLEDESEQMELPGELICKWTQIFKPKNKDEKEREEAMKLTADNLFINLFEGEEEPSMENAPLKHFLGLMLERRRVLKVMEKDDQFIQYMHRPTKRLLPVPIVNLDTQFFIENQERLAVLLTGSVAESSETPKAEPVESE